MLISIAISEIRRGCGYPHEAELSDPSILLELWQVLTHYRSLLNLTSEAWSIKRYPFFIDPGTPTDKPLTLNDFGVGIFVTSKDETNPYFIQRTINIVTPEQMSMYYSGPTNLQIGGTWWTPHVAQAFSIFNENNQWRIQWLPAHQSQAEYTLWYSTGMGQLPPLFDDTMNFPVEDSSWLIIADTVMNLMPHLADEKMGLNPKQQGLMQIAQKKVQQFAPVLEARRWDGPRREISQKRKIFGQRRGGGSQFF